MLTLALASFLLLSSVLPSKAQGVDTTFGLSWNETIPPFGWSFGEFFSFIDTPYGQAMTSSGPAHLSYQLSAYFNGSTLNAVCGPQTNASTHAVLIPVSFSLSGNEEEGYMLTWVNDTVTLPDGTLEDALALEDGTLVTTLGHGEWGFAGNVYTPSDVVLTWEAPGTTGYGVTLGQISSDDISC